MERGILLLWRENNKLLYLGILLQAQANKKEILIEAHHLQRWHGLAEAEHCRKHTWMCGVIPEVVACSHLEVGIQIQLRRLEMLSAWGVHQCATT